ncbi:MAG: MBL fold metallo-hydrolase [Asgard group archaeon]|nr:MBL fold metallo-hydrolase [Asgard group archaeon]
MGNLESITKHVVVDTTTQRTTRSCILAGISFDTCLLVIETGHSLEVGTSLRKNIENYFKIPVKYVFLTHTHNDHRDGREAFLDSILILSNNCLGNMPKRISLKKFDKITFDDKLVIEENNFEVEFFLTKGHSIGHSVAYFPFEKVLFGGDLFIYDSVNFGLPFMSFYQNKPKRTGNPEEYISAYESFKKMDLDFIIPGHGDIIDKPYEVLDEYLHFFNELKTHFKEAINDGKDYDEIEYPDLDLVKRAWEKAEKGSPPSKHKNFLKHYLEVLKTSLYNYYSGKFYEMENEDK